MSYVVQNDWKFDKDRLKSELNRVLAEHGVNERREGGLHGIALSSQDGSLQSGFNFNVRIQYPLYHEQDMTDPDPENIPSDWNEACLASRLASGVNKTWLMPIFISSEIDYISISRPPTDSRWSTPR